MVRLRGFGLTDDGLRALNVTAGPSGCDGRGFLHDDEQIRILSPHLNFQNGPVLPNRVRSQLDFIRGFLLQGWLQDAQVPARRERNAALARLFEQLQCWLAAINALAALPGWLLVDLPETDDLTRSRVFLTLPDRLRLVAAMMRAELRDCLRVSSDAGGRASLLRPISICADDLADTLLGLDFVSQEDVLNHLPRGQDYAVNTLSEVVGITIRLSAAVETALQVGRRSPGPRPSKELRQAVFWLAQLFEECGGRFTHTPRDKTHYDAYPHSAAGQFIITFLAMCDETIRPGTVSSVLAEIVKDGKYRAK